MLTVFRSRISFLSFLYQFQLAIDFVTGLSGEECFFFAFSPFSEDYIKRKDVGIASGYCILCTTMPRINWLLLKRRRCCFCFFSFEGFLSHQEHRSSSVRFTFRCYPLWTFRFSTPLINCRSVICPLLSSLSQSSRKKPKKKKNTKKKKEKKKHSNFTGMLLCAVYLSFSVIVCSRYHLDTLSKSAALHTRTVIFIIIDRKSRHINRMKNNQMEIDTYIFFNSIESTVTSFSLYFRLFLFSIIFFVVCLRCWMMCSKRASASSGEILQQ